MSVFLKILQCIFCCEEEQHDDIYDKNSYRSPLLESLPNDTSVRRSSAPSYNDLLRQSDPTKIYYYESYPNLSVSKLTGKEPSALSLLTKVVVDTKQDNSAIAKSVYDKKSLERTNELFQNLKSSSHLQTTFPYKPPTSSPKPPQSSSTPLSSSTTYPSSFKPPTSSSKPSLSSHKPTTSSTLSPSFSKPPSSSTLSPSFSKPPSSSTGPSLPSTKPPPSSSNPSPSFPKPEKSTSKPSPSFLQPVSSFETPLSSHKPPPSSTLFPSSSPKPSRSSSQLSPSSPKPPTYSFKPSPSSPKASSSSAESSQSSFGICPSSAKPRPSSKPTLSLLPSNLKNKPRKTKYVWVQKDTSTVYKIPKDIEDLMKENIVPEVLEKPLSPSTYKDYFAALLYAEDFYIEKWNGFLLKNVTLKLQEAKIYKRRHKNRYYDEGDEKDDKIFVAFEIDCIPEERPFLLSRDFVFARPLGSEVEPFEGIIYRVVNSNTVLAEFGEDFHSRHNSTRKYDVSFSFNRVCLKRAHQAIASASDSLFRDFIFPNNFVSRKCFPTSPPLHRNHKLDLDQNYAVSQILSLEAPPPYLVEGSGDWSVVREAVRQIYRSSNPAYRVLICAPTNRKCDALMRSLKQEIPESDMFRANAAFREKDGVPIDILPSCLYKRECFVCPPLQELRKFRIIFSTFMSSFRLCNEGITSGHFSHVFLMDASSVTEPETMVALANLANEETIVVVTGILGDRSRWVRSDIARHNGLRISYFERLHKSKQYRSLDPEFITRVTSK